MVDHEHCSRRPTERWHLNIPRDRVVPVTNRCRINMLKVTQSRLSGELLAADFILVDRAITIRIVKIGRHGEQDGQSEFAVVRMSMRADQIMLVMPGIAPDSLPAGKPEKGSNHEQDDQKNG